MIESKKINEVANGVRNDLTANTRLNPKSRYLTHFIGASIFFVIWIVANDIEATEIQLHVIFAPVTMKQSHESQESFYPDSPSKRNLKNTCQHRDGNHYHLIFINEKPSC